jgi:signal transduction histidine kinase
MLSMKGNTQAIRQLVSILMDNALKYSPAGGTIALTLRKQNRSIVLTVWNTTEIPVNGDNLKYVFDRFYRTDLSRNSETGGHGIGLSIAKAIVTSHNGKIHASTQDGHSFQITATFPL